MSCPCIPHSIPRINRNIVECKVVTLLSIFYHRSVLIETLWNVKSFPGMPFAPSFPVLIETLWNVKLEVISAFLYTLEVLIETLWNVKMNVLPLHSA